MDKSQKPQGCTYPDCFSCPYSDCRYSTMTPADFTEQNRRDAEHRERPVATKEYQQRSEAEDGRKPYYREYYQRNREHKLIRNREYRKNHPAKIREIQEAARGTRNEYYREYYQKHKAKKNAQAMERYYELKNCIGK